MCFWPLLSTSLLDNLSRLLDSARKRLQSPVAYTVIKGRIRTVPSCDPDTSVPSVGENSTVVTLSLCSLNVVTHVPSFAFHRRTVLSDAADAMTVLQERTGQH